MMNLERENGLINILLTCLVFFFLLSCNEHNQTKIDLPLGTWKGIISQQGQELPFLFESSKRGGKTIITLLNGEERLEIDEVSLKGDSIYITFNFFDTEIKAKIDGQELKGAYNKRYSDGHVLPFYAKFNETDRFQKRSNDLVGTTLFERYEVTFFEEDGSSYPAIAKLKQNKDRVSGTFLTETGDYRFLDGVIDQDTLKLSSFDGTHLFLFTARVLGDSLIGGQFWHGKNTYEKWIGKKNLSASLTDPDALTFLKEGYDKISFSFPDLDGNEVSLDDEKYKDKVIILQIFGSWCPNCMDETKFYTAWYKENKINDLAIIGLAYENKADFTYASKRVKKMKRKLEAPYDFLIAGISDKTEAS